MKNAIVAMVFLSVSLAPLAAEDWPEFLGPHRNGVSTEKNLNWDWDKNKPKVLWKVPLGSGYGSFAVVGDRLYTMTNRGKRDLIVCLDAKDGSEAWAFDAAPAYTDNQRQGTGPRATPTFHNGKLYCLMPMGELICLSADGKTKHWEKNIFTEVGAKNPAGQHFYWGVSYSPLVEGDHVIVQPGGKETSVAAFHKDTGKLVWKAGDGGVGYASPIAITITGQRTVIVPTGQTILGIEPVKGTILWRYAFGNPFNAICSNPVWADDTLFVSAAYGTGCAALTISKDDKEWKVTEKWKDRKALLTLYSTSVVNDGYLFGCNGDLGAIFLRCVNLEKGGTKWNERIDARSHLLLVDNHLLVWSERGHLSVVAPQADSYKRLQEWPDLLTYKSWAAPALADGRLYLRDERNALCIDLRK